MSNSALIDALFDSPNEGLILVDAVHIITRMNATASELLEAECSGIRHRTKSMLFCGENTIKC